MRELEEARVMKSAEFIGAAAGSGAQPVNEVFAAMNSRTHLGRAEAARRALAQIDLVNLPSSTEQLIAIDVEEA